MDTNPSLDMGPPHPSRCGNKNPLGEVFFLAGVSGVQGTVAPPVTRKCTVPAHARFLFFPILNTVWTDCSRDFDTDLDQLEALTIFTNKRTYELSVNIDGCRIETEQLLKQNYAFSDINEMRLPKDNVFEINPRGCSCKYANSGWYVALDLEELRNNAKHGTNALTITWSGAARNKQTGDVEFELEQIKYLLTLAK